MICLIAYFVTSSLFIAIQTSESNSNSIVAKQRELSSLKILGTQISTKLDSIKTIYKTPLHSSIFSQKLNQLCKIYYVEIKTTSVKVSLEHSENYTISCTLSGSYNNLILVLFELEKYHPYITTDNIKFHTEGNQANLFCDLKFSILNTYE